MANEPMTRKQLGALKMLLEDFDADFDKSIRDWLAPLKGRRVTEHSQEMKKFHEGVAELYSWYKWRCEVCNVPFEAFKDAIENRYCSDSIKKSELRKQFKTESQPMQANGQPMFN